MPTATATKGTARTSRTNTVAKRAKHVSMLEAARSYVAAGFSVIPVVPGSKKPAVPWKSYQKHIAKDGELEVWFDGTDNLVGIVTGSVSGNLEVLDFDNEEAFREFKKLVNTVEEANGAAAPCVVVRTPSGGHHVYYRLTEAPAGNTVLARDTAGSVRIETRGEGGYVLAPPSAGYELRHRALSLVPLLEPAQHDTLVRMARAFNDQPEEIEHGERQERKPGELRPGDDYNSRGETQGNVREALLHAGWKQVGERGANELWQRPGKADDGPSATLNPELGCFYVFSSNAQPFAPMRGYSYFSVYVHLKHGGDFAAAASALNKEGYGDKPVDNGVEIISDGFGTILPINSHVLPMFPIHVFPPWQRDMIEGVCVATETPHDLASMLALSCAGVGLSKRVSMEPLDNGWIEQPGLYTLCIMGVAENKTAVTKYMIRPIEDYERRTNQGLKGRIAEQEEEKAALDGRLKTARERAKTASEDMMPEVLESIRQIKTKIAEVEDRAVSKIDLIADDVTPERLIGLMARNEGRIAILSGEGGVFEMISGRYSGGVPNLDVYLKGHGGDMIKVQRMGRPEDEIPHPALTMGIAAQPAVLSGIVKSSILREKGFMARWIYSIPESRKGGKEFEGGRVSDDVLRLYARNLQTILAMTCETDEFGDPAPHVLHWSEEASREYRRVIRAFESRYAKGGDMEDMADWAGKWRGALARFATILHCCWHVGEEPWTWAVSTETLQRALDIADYAACHAKAAYDYMGVDETTHRARRLLDWIQSRGVEEFSKRQVQASLPHLFPRADDLDKPILFLIERGYLLEIKPVEHRTAGRKPGSRFAVNQRLWTSDTNKPVIQRPFEEVCRGRVRSDPAS